MRVACYCGTSFDAESAAGRCPYCGEVVAPDPRTETEAVVNLEDGDALQRSYRDAREVRLSEWREELQEIVSSYQYAFAMGHGCAMGPKAPSEKVLLRRVDVLRALIREHS